MAMKNPRVRVPKAAKKGDIIQIKTIAPHKMETGRRKDKKTGEVIARMIINRFVCTFNGKELFSADIHRAVTGVE
ncbi:MAG: thiosulfate oxidation carrier complex protein SoxZ [Rhodospirillales bacterium]